MDINSIYDYLLKRDGTNQSQRILPGLIPGYIAIDERSPEDILRFVRNVASQIQYYNQGNVPEGDWGMFFEGILDTNEREDMPPHAALLLACVRLFSLLQKDLNTLTQKHVDHFYEQTLQFNRNEVLGDKVHVFFELNKGVSNHLVLGGTLLNGGKDALGNALLYKTAQDLLINRTSVEQVKSVFWERDVMNRAILYKAGNAKSVTEPATGTEHWRPFGDSQSTGTDGLKIMEAVQPGFAIASPMFSLSEGLRKIALKIDIRKDPASILYGQSLKEDFEISLTGPEGWLNPYVTNINIIKTAEDLFTLTFNFVMEDGAPAVVAYSEATHKAGYLTDFPVLRCLLKPEAYKLDFLKHLKIEQVQIDLDIDGVKDLVLQNDAFVQSPDQPILPFGTQPFLNSNFYVGHAESFSKPLRAFALELEWQDVPKNLEQYYDAYGVSLQYEYFSCKMEFLHKKKWDAQLITIQPLFEPNTEFTRLEIWPKQFEKIFKDHDYIRRRPDLLEPFSEFGTQTTHGFVKVVLTGPNAGNSGVSGTETPFEAFGHKAFPNVYAQQAINLSKSIAGAKLPNPPYTPTLKSVKMDYEASLVFKPGATDGPEQFFMQDAFGYQEAQQGGPMAQILPDIPGEGVLYIGLKEAVMPQTLSLLFQIEEATFKAEPFLASKDLQWSYLTQKGWKMLQQQEILQENTQGFQTSGIVGLTIGKDASTSNPFLPQGLHWLRVHVEQHALGASKIVDIHTQAALASLVAEGGDFSKHLVEGLSSGSISKLVDSVAVIKKIHQPYASFGGRTRESDVFYYQRVSERLRHRQRSVTPWDIERNVLEAFPQIFKVKCLNQSRTGTTGDGPVPVKIVVIPDLRKGNGFNILEPRVTGLARRQIREMLENTLASPFAKFEVENPAYERLLVDTGIVFKIGFDPGYYARQLETEIIRFLSPWAYEEGKDIVFGGKIYRSELLAFVEGRPYVDYIVDLKLYHVHDGPAKRLEIGDMSIGQTFVVGISPPPVVGRKTIGASFVIGEPVETAVATLPESILVSSPYHRITPLRIGEYVCESASDVGISYMVVGLDFKVTNS